MENLIAELWEGKKKIQLFPSAFFQPELILDPFDARAWGGGDGSGLSVCRVPES